MVDVKKFMEKMSDYLDDLLSEEERKKFEVDLEECPECRKALDSFKKLREKMRGSVPKPSAEAKLKVYEALNAERAKRGEELLKIPAELLKLVKAKSDAAVEAAKSVAGTSAGSMKELASTGADMAQQRGKSALNVGKKAAETFATGAKAAKDVAVESGKTMVDTGKIVTVESAEVMADSMKSPTEAAKAPARLAGKGIKAGVTMAKGAAKVMGKGIKGSAEVAKGTMEVGATTAKEAAKTAKDCTKVTKAAKAAKDIASSIVDGAKDVAKAKPEGSEDRED